MPITQATQASRKRSIPLHHTTVLDGAGNRTYSRGPYDGEPSGGTNAPVVDPARPRGAGDGQPRVCTVRSGRRHASKSRRRSAFESGSRGEGRGSGRERARATGGKPG